MKLRGLTNYDEHPTEAGWTVFRFAQPEAAAEFAAELEQAGIRCERDEPTEAPYLVAVRDRHHEPAVRINYRVLGRRRKPFMADPWLRWTVLALVLGLVALALIGALRAHA
jgi:hypothetical protein